ncbi:N-acetyltransferase GCN5 [Bacillus sp. J14TS2]|uniref:GNAT family N-acetyltransferase n=1 Tax=Bacillus sp. J14TS2 TaxID=2807188 RepID=UPI001B06382B|nr:GNAT family N-acetyltransferase [Bacillus sp. J14TS2]GIN72899.1 N-acetyltransferase GCN5 [Bacillus sp. J14TS2]
MIRTIEELSLNAWPSLSSMVYDGWLLRFSNGYTKRANSVNPIYTSAVDIDKKIHYCEHIFADRNLKPVFKMTELAYPDRLDMTLEGHGYTVIDQTSVQLLSLSNLKDPLIDSVKWEERVKDEWLNQFCKFNQQNECNRVIMKQMLSMIIPKTCFISLYNKETVVACGLGVLEREYLGVFDIVTDPQWRNRGFAEQLMLNLLKWGKKNGAEFAYLQVVLNNRPALNLYSKLGFQEKYQYWYRVKAE